MEKIKHWAGTDRGKDILTVLIVILVGLGSFWLGRLSKESPSPKLQIDATNQAGNALMGDDLAQNTSKPAQTNVNTSGKSFFASSRGKKYYTLNCSAGKSIKQENRIYFATVAEATAARYTASTSCN